MLTQGRPLEMFKKSRQEEPPKELNDQMVKESKC
jgi:hypothetical protein